MSRKSLQSSKSCVMRNSAPASTLAGGDVPVGVLEPERLDVPLGVAGGADAEGVAAAARRMNLNQIDGVAVAAGEQAWNVGLALWAGRRAGRGRSRRPRESAPRRCTPASRSTRVRADAGQVRHGARGRARVTQAVDDAEGAVPRVPPPAP